MLFFLCTVLFLILIALFDYLFIPLAFGHGTWWLFASLLAKLAAAMALSSVTLVSRRKWPVALLATILAVWIITNGLYFHATGLFITYDVVKMIGGLRGFTSSILAYVKWDTMLLAAIFLLFIPLLIYVKSQPSLRRFSYVWLAIVICSLLAAPCHYMYKHEMDVQKPAMSVDYFRMFDLHGDAAPETWKSGEHWYIERHSIAMALPHMLVHAYHYWQENRHSDLIVFTEAEEAFLHRNPGGQPAEPNGHLVIVLVESLESWVLEQEDANGNPVTPCLNAYIASRPTLLATWVWSQKRFGESGDGQMIINSGLLPLIEGVACIKYSGNTYPNLAHFYPHSSLINPKSGAWNQTKMTERYGYRRLIEPEGNSIGCEWTDEDIMQHCLQACDTATGPICVMALTISSHTPFIRVEPALQLPEELPQDRNRYLQCIHYADSCIGGFLQWADTATCMQQATVVITGDHIIFPDGYCPLIISSPAITQSVRLDDPCYQMDIFPTVLYCIGQTEYEWQGFGINLLQPGPRPINPESALVLSDKLIRKDYFCK